jgi:lactoylglutathione lyase
MRLSLLVIRATDVPASLAFYQTLGLEFVQEQHGAGPVRYSCNLNGTVIEIYPANAPLVENSLALGFEVPSLTPILDAVRSAGFIVVFEPRKTEWGNRAVVQDPDGRRVELVERLDGCRPA